MRILIVDDSDQEVLDVIEIKKGPRPEIEDLEDNNIYHDELDEICNELTSSIKIATKRKPNFI